MSSILSNVSKSGQVGESNNRRLYKYPTMFLFSIKTCRIEYKPNK